MNPSTLLQARNDDRTRIHASYLVYKAKKAKKNQIIGMLKTIGQAKVILVMGEEIADNLKRSKFSEGEPNFISRTCKKRKIPPFWIDMINMIASMQIYDKNNRRTRAFEGVDISRNRLRIIFGPSGTSKTTLICKGV